MVAVCIIRIHISAHLQAEPRLKYKVLRIRQSSSVNTFLLLAGNILINSLFLYFLLNLTLFESRPVAPFRHNLAASPQSTVSETHQRLSTLLTLFLSTSFLNLVFSLRSPSSLTHSHNHTILFWHQLSPIAILCVSTVSDLLFSSLTFTESFDIAWPVSRIALLR